MNPYRAIFQSGNQPTTLYQYSRLHKANNFGGSQNVYCIENKWIILYIFITFLNDRKVLGPHLGI